MKKVAVIIVAACISLLVFLLAGCSSTEGTTFTINPDGTIGIGVPTDYGTIYYQTPSK